MFGCGSRRLSVAGPAASYDPTKGNDARHFARNDGGHCSQLGCMGCL
jgi:hypothetical protein